MLQEQKSQQFFIDLLKLISKKQPTERLSQKVRQPFYVHYLLIKKNMIKLNHVANAFEKEMPKNYSMKL